jgi:hypothetical protein
MSVISARIWLKGYCPYGSINSGNFAVATNPKIIFKGGSAIPLAPLA